MIKKTIRNIYEYWLDWKFSTKLTSAILVVTLCSMVALLIVNFMVNTREQKEQMGTQWITLGDQILLRASDKVNEEVKLMKMLAKTPSLIAAINGVNRARATWTPEMIASKDQAWVDQDPSLDATIQAIAENAVSMYLIDFRKNNPEEVEVFITDNKGLNMAMTDPTSDFLQADEEWWKAAFTGGSDAIYFGSVEYDESAKTYAMNIGIPILDPESNQPIGVLRGTLDVSVLIDTLDTVQIGKTGNIVLLDSNGTVLYSRTPDHFMKPAPDSILALFRTEQNGWKQTTDLDGHRAVVTYHSMDKDRGESLGWRVLVTETTAETNQGVIRSLLISLLTGILVTAVGILLSRLVILESIVAPLTMLTKKAHELSTGNVTSQASDSATAKLDQRKDEIGEINRAFNRLMDYFQGAASASTAIANKDLTVSVTANSEQDVLGIAFKKMIYGLQSVIGQVAESARAVSAAAAQLATASDQSGRATNQIAATIQQVTLGTTQQSEDVKQNLKFHRTNGPDDRWRSPGRTGASQSHWESLRGCDLHGFCHRTGNRECAVQYWRGCESSRSRSRGRQNCAGDDGQHANHPAKG